MERCQALVLGSTRFSESSKIVTLFTREWGRMSVMAKGALRKGSRFGPALELFSLIRCQVAISHRREVQTLASADLEDYFPRLRERPGPLCAAEAAVELVRQAVHPSSPQIRLFDLLLAYLKRLDREAEESHARIERLVWTFILHLLGALGWGIRLSSCARCGANVSGGSAVLSAQFGGALCRACEPGVPDGRRHSADDLRLLAGLSAGPFDGAADLPGDGRRVNETLRAFLNARFEKNVPLKSLDLFYQFS